MKNALDWLVSYEGFVGKPVALLNASPRARHAYEAPAETLGTMSARLIREASVTIALLGSGLDEEGMVRSPVIAAALRGALQSLEAALARGAAAGPSLPLC